MKKVGRQVNIRPATPENSRNSEGDFIRLKDGAILHVYSRFGASSEDNGRSDLACIRSYDEGEHWTEPEILIARDAPGNNLMCPCLLRMRNGDLGLIYCRKQEHIIPNRLLFIRSADEGKSWSEPTDMNEPGHYTVIENGHALMLENGRILLPANDHAVVTDPSIRKNTIWFEGADAGISLYGKMRFFCSDDDGASWRALGVLYDSPYLYDSATGLQETAVCQLTDGTVRALSRTDQLCQFESRSEDNGESWSTVVPNRFFSSPVSPIVMKRNGELAVAIFNPCPNYTTRFDALYGDNPYQSQSRSPLVMAVSRDGGNSFPDICLLDGAPDKAMCYPSVFFGEDYLLVDYGKDLDEVMLKIGLDEI